MKIIITSTGETLESEFDQRFGRCAYFCVLDTETSETNLNNKLYESTNKYELDVIFNNFFINI